MGSSKSEIKTKGFKRHLCKFSAYPSGTSYIRNHPGSGAISYTLLVLSSDPKLFRNIGINQK